jgi:hypothetical protein
VFSDINAALRQPRPQNRVLSALLARQRICANFFLL